MSQLERHSPPSHPSLAQVRFCHYLDCSHIAASLKQLALTADTENMRTQLALYQSSATSPFQDHGANVRAARATGRDGEEV
jgi:hypothetical protein